MPKTPETLEPNLKILYDSIEESGEEGIRLDELFDKLKINGHDVETLINIMDSLNQLGELGLAHKKIIESKTERGYEGEIRWFAAGKGDSIPNLQYGGKSLYFSL